MPLNTRKARCRDGMVVELWPIDRPVPYVGNPRRVPQSAIDKIALSLKEFGWQQPIVVDRRDVIIAGHTRLLAAKSLAFENVPVHVATNLSAVKADAYRLMDNRSAEETEWNELIGPQLLKLQKQSYELALTGFSEPELNRLFRVHPVSAEVQEVSPARLPDGRFRRPGAVWQLGSHSLVCAEGDGLDVAVIVEAWEKFTGGKARLQH